MLFVTRRAAFTVKLGRKRRERMLIYLLSCHRLRIGTILLGLHLRVCQGHGSHLGSSRVCVGERGARSGLLVLVLMLMLVLMLVLVLVMVLMPVLMGRVRVATVWSLLGVVVSRVHVRTASSIRVRSVGLVVGPHVSLLYINVYFLNIKMGRKKN